MQLVSGRITFVPLLIQKLNAQDLLFEFFLNICFRLYSIILDRTICVFAPTYIVNKQSFVPRLGCFGRADGESSRKSPEAS